MQNVEREEARRTRAGIPIYSYRNPGAHGFCLSLFVRAGILYEDDGCPGITHFLEHVAIRNVNRVMDGGLYAELDRTGVEFNAATYAEMVQFYTAGASTHFDVGAKVLTKLLSPVILDKLEIDAERRRIKAEIRESDDKNSLASFSAEAVYGETPLALPIVGTNRSVDRVTAARLEHYRRSVFTKDNLFYYVTGNFTEDDLAMLAALSDAWEIDPPAPGAPRENVARVPADFGKRQGGAFVKSADYTVVRWTFDLDMTRLSLPETDLLYDILLSGYDSRFFIEMSERRGLFYDVSGALERFSNIGTLHFSYELKEKDLLTAAKITVGILADLKRELLPESRLMRAGYTDNACLLLDDVREENFTFAYDNHVMHAGYASMEERVAAYSAVTPERIREIAREVFRKENLTITLKGNPKHIRPKIFDDILSALDD